MNAARLSPAARELLARRAKQAAEHAIAPRPREERAPLSPAQLPHWLYSRLEPESPLLNLPKRLRLRGPLDEQALEALTLALNAIVRRHEVLRSTVHAGSGAPELVISPPSRMAIPVVDLGTRTVTERDSECTALLDEHARRPFDLARDLPVRALLVRLTEATSVLQVTFHHVAFDGWSTGVFFDELGAFYAAFTGRQAVSIAEPPVRFGDVAAWEHDRGATPERAAALAWWRERMGGASTTAELGADRPRAARPTRAGAHVSRTIPADLVARAKALALEEGATLFAVIAQALHSFVARRSGSGDPILGIISAGRHASALEPLIGNFMSALPLRAPLDPGESFRAHLGRVQSAWLECVAHGEVPIQSHAIELFPDWRPSHGPLFPVLLNFRNMSVRPPALPGLEVDELPVPVLGTMVDLHLNVTEVRRGDSDHGEPGSLFCDLVYSAERFDAATAERLLDGFHAWLAELARAPDAPLDSLDVMPAGERRLVLEAWNETRTEVPRVLRTRHTPAHAGLAAQAAARPDALALVLGRSSLTYAELQRRVLAVAARLRELGIGPGALVGLATERSFEMVVGLFAILETGAAFVALDPQQPPARLSAMAADAGVAALVTEPGLRGRVGDGSVTTVLLSEGGQRIEVSSTAARPIAAFEWRDLAYVAYTSGTTGKPKGCMVEHASLVNLIADRAQRSGLDGESRLLQVAALGFEGAFDALLAAWAGSCLVLVSHETLLRPEALLDEMRRQRVTHAGFTPALLGGLPAGDLPDLRDLTIGGEAAPRELYLRWASPHRRVWNEYGPTECTVWCAMERIDAGHERVGIGRAVANTRLYVLDARREPVPIGVTGELWIAGAAVGRGYLGLDELTAERFVRDPFVPGERMYRSGDLARWLPRGSVEILGRGDRQLKIRGQRLEPAEIESALTSHPRCKEVVVTKHAPSEEGASDLLVAYYTSDDGRPIAAAALQRVAKERLPSFMWPEVYVHLASLPLTSNGKLDTAALPGPTRPEARAGGRRRPRVVRPNKLQEIITDIWRALLPGRDPGLDDDFLDIGGHSLLAARMIHEVSLATGVDLPLEVVLTGVTIRRLGRWITDDARHHRGECVCVQPGSTGRTPFFMLHGDLDGAAVYCRGVTRACGPDVPFYTLAPPSPAEARAFGSIEAVAEHHLAALRRVRPHGPYRLGGYCVSGLVAYEMACRLERAGEAVELVLLVDTRPSLLPGRYTALLKRLIALVSRRPERRALIEDALLARAEHLRSLTARDVASYLRDGFERLGRRGKKAAARARAKVVKKPVRDNAYGRLRRRFVPTAFSGRLDVLWSAPYGPRAHAERWGPIVGELHLAEVPSGHNEILWMDLPRHLAAAIARLDGT